MKGKIGRPRKAGEPGRKMSLGLKVTAELKEMLDAAATASGRTQSQQAEMMLRDSFRDAARTQEIIAEAQKQKFRSAWPLYEKIGHALQALVMQAEMSLTSGNTLEDPAIYAQAEDAVGRVLKALRPPGDPTKFGDLRRVPINSGGFPIDEEKIWALERARLRVMGALAAEAALPGSQGPFVLDAPAGER
jgi:hypothetical protein